MRLSLDELCNNGDMKEDEVMLQSANDSNDDNPSSNVLESLSLEGGSMEASKVYKAAKPGEKAPQDAIRSWKENGFSRFTSICLCHVCYLR